MGGAVDGGDAVHGLLTQLLGAFPDFWLEQTAVHHADDTVIVECRFGGTHRGPWGGIAATGNRTEVQAACIFVFEGDRLVCEKVNQITPPSSGNWERPCNLLKIEALAGAFRT